MTRFPSLKQIFFESSMPTYSSWLEKMGFIYPTHDKPGIDYINVHGKPDKASEENKFMLVTYIPKKSEYHFSTPGEAINKVFDLEPAHWQIVNSITGEILLDPLTLGK